MANITCSPACKTALREDRKAGLIYGPYGEKLPGGGVKYVSQEQFCAETNTCAYCGGTLKHEKVKRGKDRWAEVAS